jgi:glycosyl transferase family 25
MKSYVITLGKRIQSFRERMNGVLQFEEFNAFDQNQIDDFKDYFKDSDIYKYSNLYKPESVIACAKSHFTLWQKCVELNEPILILEDDAVFYDDSAIDIFKRTDFNALDFDIFYLDGKLVKDPYVVQEAYEFHSGVAYIIKPEAARKVINKVQEFGFSRALDWELIIMRSHGLKLKSFNNIVIVPKEGEKSDIKI